MSPPNLLVSTALAALAALASGIAVAAEPAPKQLAIMSPRGTVLKTEVAKGLADRARAGALAAAGAQLSVASRAPAGKCADEECDLRTARRGGADYGLTIAVLAVDSELQVMLTLTDLSTGRLLATQEIVSANQAGALKAMSEASRKLVEEGLRQKEVPAPGALPPDPSPGVSAPEAPVSNRRDDPSTGISWLRIPGGSFAMGCVAGDRHCDPRAEARPPVKRQVEPFWLARTETTIGQYQRCADAGACSKMKQAHPRTHALVFEKCARVAGNPQAPMDCVTWEEAGAFCAWAGGRLPSASEWEYAAKSGRDVVYPWGNAPPDGSRGRFGKSEGGPVDVGAFPPTTWGLHDMAGNVSEWTSSAYFEQGRSEDVGAKETRGGSYTSKRDSLGAARRSELLPFMQRPWIGFRCAQDERPPAPPAPSPQGFALPDFQTMPIPELARLVGPGAQLNAAHVGPLENDSRINRLTEVSTLPQHELNARFQTSTKPRSRGLSLNVSTYYQDLQRGLARGQHVQHSVMDATSNGSCQPFEPDQHPGFGKTRVGVFSWSEATPLLRACARSGTVRYERNLQGMLTVTFNLELNDGTRLTTDPLPVPDTGTGF